MKNDIEHIWSVMSQKSIVDMNTNNLSILDILERINVVLNSSDKFNDKNPATIPFLFEVISYWRKSDAVGNKEINGESKICIYSPTKHQLSDFSIKFQIPKDKKFYRTIIKFNAFKITEEGEYRVEILQKVNNGEHIVVANLPVFVELKSIKQN
jgi:hypothetical protein